MRILWIRHGKTAGNLKKRYIGRTDEPLCPEGRRELEEKVYPVCSRVIASPMRRCLETARLIYPGKDITVFGDLRECDFGAFEGKNYQELSEDRAYRSWIDSNGTLPFPGGESREAFEERCCLAFLAAVSGCGEEETAAFVVHGGTIMAVLARFGVPKRDMYAYQVGNGCGYETWFDRAEETLRIDGEIR